MKCYRRRRRYNRLSSLAGSDDEDDQNQKIAMLGGQNQSQVKYYMKNIVLPKLHQKKMTSITLLKGLEMLMWKSCTALLKMLCS